MPMQVRFMDKDTGRVMAYDDLDRDIAKLLGRPCDPINWVQLDCGLNWYDTIVYALATGATLKEIRDCFPDDKSVQTVIDYLNEYEVNVSWVYGQ